MYTIACTCSTVQYIVYFQENVLLKKDLEACQKGTAINAEGDDMIL